MTENAPAEAEMEAKLSRLEATEKILYYRLTDRLRVGISRNPNARYLFRLLGPGLHRPEALSDSEVDDLLAALVFVKRLVCERSRHYVKTNLIPTHIRLRGELKFRMGQLHRAYREGREILED